MELLEKDTEQITCPYDSHEHLYCMSASITAVLRHSLDGTNLNSKLRSRLFVLTLTSLPSNAIALLC